MFIHMQLHGIHIITLQLYTYSYIKHAVNSHKLLYFLLNLHYFTLHEVPPVQLHQSTSGSVYQCSYIRSQNYVMYDQLANLYLLANNCTLILGWTLSRLHKLLLYQLCTVVVSIKNYYIIVIHLASQQQQYQVHELSSGAAY